MNDQGMSTVESVNRVESPWYKEYRFTIIVAALIILVLIFIILRTTGIFDSKKEEVKPIVPVQPPTPVEPSVPSPFSNTEPLEPFTNDLPYQLNNLSIKYSNEDTDYNDVLQDMALDNEVKSQHKQYVTDRNKITSTASFVPSRSDTQDIVPRWGLSSSSFIPIDSSAREIPSQEPEQGPKPFKLRWN